MPALPSFDFTDLALFAEGDPHEVWRALRQHDPVHWHEQPEGRGFWLLTRHADILRASRAGETFASHRGVGLVGPQDTMAPPDVRLPSPHGERLLNYLDPPDHTVFRRLIARSFTPRTLERLKPVVRSVTEASIARVREARSAEFVSEIATQIPLHVLCELMGIPQEHWEQLALWTHQMEPGDDEDHVREGETRARTRRIAFNELVRYLRELIEARHSAPRPGLIGELGSMNVAGRMTDGEVVWFCILLINAGHETVRNALSGGVLALLEHPAERERLRADPTLLGTAVEEVLRWTSPIVFFSRYVTRDTDLGGRAIRAGQRVLLLYPSANRDEHVFAEPFRFDVGRSPNEHLAFGIGHHFCLGASLARLQLEIALPALLEAFTELELAGPVVRLRSNFNAGIKHLPLRW